MGARGRPLQRSCAALKLKLSCKSQHFKAVNTLISGNGKELQIYSVIISNLEHVLLTNKRKTSPTHNIIPLPTSIRHHDGTACTIIFRLSRVPVCEGGSLTGGTPRTIIDEINPPAAVTCNNQHRNWKTNDSN